MKAQIEKNIAVILPPEDSYWVSCKFIIRNFLTSLSILKGSFNLHFFKTDQVNDLFYKTNIDHIFYLNPYDHPDQFLEKLPSNFRQEKISIVVFGNYLKDIIRWFNFLNNNQLKLRFIVASEAQKKILNRFFIGEVDIIPFPVDSTIYKLRTEGRMNHHDNLVFVFAGRISQQKNIHILISFLARAKKENILNDCFKLKIIGSFDDQYLPLSDESAVLGTYYHQIFHEVSHDVGIDFFQQHIEFLGPMEPDKLALEFRKSDIFVSLSTFTHEDYGLAAAEALESGLRVILSKWGGHISFKNYFPTQVSFVDVDIKSNTLELKYESFKKALVGCIPPTQFLRGESQLNEQRIAELLTTHFSSANFDVPKLHDDFSDFIQKVKLSPDSKYSLEVLKDYAT